jgi:hypothetical protein
MDYRSLMTYGCLAYRRGNGACSNCRTNLNPGRDWHSTPTVTPSSYSVESCMSRARTTTSTSSTSHFSNGTTSIIQPHNHFQPSNHNHGVYPAEHHSYGGTLSYLIHARTSRSRCHSPRRQGWGSYPHSWRPSSRSTRRSRSTRYSLQSMRTWRTSRRGVYYIYYP